MPNHLIHETSPYLLQHAYQPVDWHPYSDKVFQLAKEQDKPLIISIGYSTCHWCHVMAHECFDDIEVADVMNQYFIPVKVDREELPDVDHYYMNAIQVLTGHGGWPLNAFVLPDGKAFYAVTYLPKNRWMDLLLKIHQLYKNEKQKLIEYAESIHQGIKHFELATLSQKSNNDEKYKPKPFKNIFEQWKTMFDKEWGGHTRVPKFVMPINYQLFLHYLVFNEDIEIENHLHTSVLNIILGGLFDHIDGGFYRYSTDKYWKIPHFEKMLYDNAQMIELLANYLVYIKNQSSKLQKENNESSPILQFANQNINDLQSIIEWILNKNIQFILNYFQSDEHLFYSAMDADSEGEEGKYYLWTEEELKTILQNDFDEFAEIFNISNHFGYWENNQYVLTINVALFLQKPKEWMYKIQHWSEKLHHYRKNRIPPATDTKIITSWNAMMIKALFHSGMVLNNHQYIQLAEQSLNSLLNKVYQQNQLYHIYHYSQPKIPAYLDDYAFLIDALIKAHQCTANAKYLRIAEELINCSIDKFYSSIHKVFFYSSAQHSINDNIQLFDDVIPSANALMIQNLLFFYHLTLQKNYQDIAVQNFNQTHSLFYSQFQYAASYGKLILLQQHHSELEISIVGENSTNYYQQVLNQIFYHPFLFVASGEDNYLVFENRFHSHKTFIYVCQHKACYEPIENPDNFNVSKFI